MKQIIILFFVLITSFSTYSQVNNLEQGDKCFEKGDYVCAEAKYNALYKSALGKEKQIAEIKIQRAQSCIALLKSANLAIANKSYIKAKENYLSILNSNPEDTYVKSQLEKIISILNKPTISTLVLNKTQLSFEANGGNSKIMIETNSQNYSIDLMPQWCSVQKYSTFFIVNCNVYSGSAQRKDYFNVIAGNKTIRVNIVQQSPPEVNETQKNQKSYIDTYIYTANEPKEKPKTKLSSFSSLGLQSGEIAKYGLLYERGGKSFIGFHMAIRTSLTSEEDILDGSVTENKSEIDLGPNFKISRHVYLNLGAGYGMYSFMSRNDYSGTSEIKKTGYLVTSAGLMIRLGKVVNINGGASFMDIDKDIYKPEIIFGLSFNLK